MSLNAIFRDIAPQARWADHFYNWLRFRKMHGRSPRRGNDATFSDRLYHLKVDDSLLDPLRQYVSDKEYVKQYVAGIVGKQHTVETIQILTSFADIEAFRLTRIPCVVKPTHLSGEVSIHTTRNQTPKKDLLKRWLHVSHYARRREQNYRLLQPKIIVEEFFSVDGETVPEDYKIFCFHGVPRFIQVDLDRFGNHLRNFYDTEWNKLSFTLKCPGCEKPDPRPRTLERMTAIAAELSRSFSFIRVDLYSVEDEVKVGELTNCPESASYSFQPVAGEEAVGRMFDRDGTTSLTQDVYPK